MSSKKGPGRFVAAHQTEAARRALIQPVPCWEYKWVIPPGMPSGSTLRLRQWVKTQRKQEFSDDEDDSQAALAPLPDEPEPDQGDEEEEEEEKEESAPAPSGLATPLPAETSMRGVPGLDTPVSGALTPTVTEPPPAINLANRLRASETKPHPLSSSFGPDDMETMENMEPLDNMETNEAAGGDPAEQGILEGETSLLDAINMDLGVVDMDVLDESTEAYMDMLNSGALGIDDDLMNSGLGEPPQ